MAPTASGPSGQHEIAIAQQLATVASTDHTIRGRDRLADNASAAEIEGSTASVSLTVRRWVGGSVGHVYHRDDARFVGGCVGSVRAY
jgi:hypothetical protein